MWPSPGSCGEVGGRVTCSFLGGLEEALSQGHGCFEDSVCRSLSFLSQGHGCIKDLLQHGASFTKRTVSATVLCPRKVPF